MAFIGNSNTTQGFTPAIDYFNGNGSTTAFTLSRPVASVAQVQVVIENVPQNPGSAYTVSGNTITFTSAPPSGTSNIYVYYTSPITQVIAPGQGTVNTTALGNITNIASGNSSLTLQTGTTPTTAMTINTSQNVGIGTSSPSAKLDIVGSANILGLTNTDGTSYEAINMTVGTQQARIVLTGQSFGDANYGTGDLTIQAQTAGKGIRFGTNGGTNQMVLDSSGNLKFNSGYGSTATAYGCRAWVNFNGTGAVAIRASGNVSSITDNGTGDYTVNFTNAMPDANYSTIVSGNSSTTADPSTTFTPIVYGQYTTKTVSAQRIISMYGNGGSAFDSASINVAVFR